MPVKLPTRTLAIAAVIVSILSVQAGASFSKHLFPIVGAEGATALRQFFAALVLLAVFHPWRTAGIGQFWRYMASCLG